MWWQRRAERAEGVEAVLRCSFCNKDQNDVRKLIAGPTVFIWDECVKGCNDIIADDARFARHREQRGDASIIIPAGCRADELRPSGRRRKSTRPMFWTSH